MDDLKPSTDYVSPVQRKNGRWDYGFQWMEVGDQMRCPIMENEAGRKAQVRVHSAALCWKNKNHALARSHIHFRTQTRSKYILIERMS